ncbi:ATP-binding protein [Salipaludibacillus sp. CF4.18]|uniref:ATP-binding protein n=1 Tax=Salipaludibacillus sp. CF4.18 TaxID=3373081 RepID=UPI003EE426B9
MTEILLLNFFFLLFPAMLYVIFFEHRLNSNNNNLFILLVSSCSIVLCMTYPIQLELGFIYDLRYIPFIIAALFGGFKIALPLYAVLNVYRFIIGGEGILLSFLFSTIVLVAVCLLSRYFLKQNGRDRLKIAALASIGTMSCYLLILAGFYETITPEFWLMAVNVLVIHVGGMIAVMAFIEKTITNIKTREKFLESEKLHIISELSASVSHEIRNPLTVTSGFLQLLYQSKGITKDDKRYVDLALQETKRAEEIVTDFLSLAKPQAEHMVHSNLKEEFEYVNKIMQSYANLHQVELDYHFDNTLIKKYDKNQLQQCLVNLYKNGIESMKDQNGTLFIDVGEHKGKISIKITDTGVGMTKEEMADIGKPYYSTKKEGTGLGMVMVYSTISKLGGSINIKTTKGKGTTFHLTIPA